MCNNFFPSEKVDEWSSAELIKWLEQNTEPKLSPDMLDGFSTADVEGATLSGLKPATLYEMITRAIETKTKIDVPESLYQETLLGTASYSVRREPRVPSKEKQIFT